jgi:hypothetical protein
MVRQKTKKKTTKESKIQKIKQYQASIQSDQIELDSWIPSDGFLNNGTTYTVDSVDPIDITYGEQMSFDYDSQLRDKYPALQDAWEHYNNILKMCKAKEKEEQQSAN